MIIGVDFVDLDFFLFFFYCVYKNARLGFYIMSVKMRYS